MNGRCAVSGALALALSGSLCAAQQAPSGNYVTREEYDRLRAQMEDMRKEMTTMKQQQAANQADIEQTIDDIEADIAKNRSSILGVQPGYNKFVLAGDAEAGFTAQRGSNSTFDAGFAPLFLWQLNDRLLFEGSLDIAGSTAPDSTSSTEVDLTLADISYLVNDYLYVGGGLFAVPFARYHNHFDPSWINELPDDPLVFGDRAITPSSETGAFLGGAVPAGSTKVEYNVWVTNGPQLITDDPNAAGSLNFDDYTDLNNSKSVGTRVGWLPLPSIDVGYSMQWAQVNPSGFENTYAWLQAVDAQYRREYEQIMGTIKFRGAWVWTNVSDVTYDPTGELGFGPVSFNNDRNGGYLQASYRPTRVSNKVIRNFEFVVRYDTINVPSAAPGGGDESRWALGIDYWLQPNVVLKVAYEWDNNDEDLNTFFVQCGIGL